MNPSGVGFTHSPSDPYGDLFLAVEDRTHIDYADTAEKAVAATTNARKWSNFQITSHIPFAVVFVLSVSMHFFEMTVLVGLVLIFSLVYHFGWEERTAFSYLDNCTAFALSMYGSVQLFFSPSPLILGINLTLGISSAIIFVFGYTQYFSHFYGWIHPIGLHILPGIWSGVVVVFQKPLLF
jgi:uncharacterized membrane protein YecN with MAPEG domain